MNGLLFFDADNTLWDTDSVFRNAQVAMLRVFQDAGLLTDPEKAISTLRLADRELMCQQGVAEYDFRLLTEVLALHFASDSTIAQAVDTALEAKFDLPTSVPP